MPRLRGERHRIVHAAAARIRRRHENAQHVLGAHGFGGDGRRQRGIDAARESQQHALETGLARIVAHAQNQSVPDLGFRLRNRPRRWFRGRLSRSTMTMSSVKRLAARDQPALGVEGATAAVEDQVVVPADLIDVENRSPVCGVRCGPASFPAAVACRRRRARRKGSGWPGAGFRRAP